MKNKRVAYFNPLINITGKFDSGESFSVEEDTCRENVVGEMWEGIEDNDGATGKGALTIKLTFGVPSEKKRDPYDDHSDVYSGWTPRPDASFVKRVRNLADSPENRKELSTLIDVLVAVPLMLYAGPKAYKGLVVPAKYKAHKNCQGYDHDVPTTEMDFHYLNSSNCAVRHPVLLSIVLGQMRLGLEEFSRGRFSRYDTALKITQTRERLRRISTRSTLTRTDKNFLVNLYKTMVELSDNTLVNRRLERYPINKTFSRYTLDFLQTGNSKEKLFKVWKDTIGNNIYDRVGQYGFYKWFELRGAQTKHQKKLVEKVKRQAYSDLEQRAFILNG